MTLLYDRKETDTEIVIVYKYQLVIYIAIIGFVLLSTVNLISDISWILIGGLALWWILGLQPVNSEIRQATKKGAVEVSGNKFSLKNPLTIKIR